MKKLLWLCVALLVVSATAAFGAPGNGIDLTWDNCVTETAPPPLNDKVFAPCDGNQTYKLIGSYKVATNMPDFFAMDISIDLQQTDNNPLVPFYHYEKPSGCNNDALLVNDVKTSTGGCASYATAWGNGSPTIFTDITAYAPNFGGENGHGRIFVTIARASSNPFALVGGTNYFGFALEFYDQNQATCAGCNTPASIVWNSATMFGNTETRVLAGADKKVFYCATVNQGISACAATPVRNTTWGQLKSIYR